MRWMQEPQPTPSHISRAAEMKTILKLLVASLILQSLLGCHLDRPDQDNFLLDGSGIGGAALARKLSSNLALSVDTTRLSLPDSDTAEVYWLDGRGFNLTLTPLPDDRCNANASEHITYEEQQFRVDLVYTASSPTVREAAKRKLLQVLRDAQIPVKEFVQC